MGKLNGSTKIITTSRELNRLISGKKRIADNTPPPAQLMVRLAIYRVLNPDDEMDSWEICTPDMIPEWLSGNPDTMAELVEGMMVKDESKGPWWYRGVVVEGVAH